MSPSMHVQPLIQVLSPDAIVQVHEYSLKILADVGVRIDSENALRRLKKLKGVTIFEDQHVVFHPDTVEWAIQQVPSFIDIYNRKRELAFRLGEEKTHFGIGVTNLFYKSPDTGEILPFTRENMRSSVGLGNKLSSYDIISTIGILRNVNQHQADLLAVLEMVAGTEKPLIILVSDKNQFVPCFNLLDQLIGNLSTKPFVIPYFNPVTPLVINQATAENMLTSIDRGLPFIFSNYGMAGVSTPITSAGTLTLLNSELLAGLVFSQLIQPGTPVILGSLPAFFDMKMMIDFYDPQTMLLNIACAEMMDHYQIPHAGTSGSSNGWGADLISAPTLTINHLTCCLGKVGLAPFVGGIHGSKVFSPNLVVYANEIIEQSRQFTRGFELNEETINFDQIKKMGIGGNYLSSPQTMKIFKNAYLSSDIFPRMSLEKWQDSNHLEPLQLLRERTLELLNNLSYPDDQDELLMRGESVIARLMRS